MPMYNGIKRKRETPKSVKFKTKHQLIGVEQIVTNGIIREQYKVQTYDFKADPNIKYDDFEVNNLKAAGIDVRTMAETKLTPSKEKQGANAETANEMMNYYDIVSNIENEQEQQQTN